MQSENNDNAATAHFGDTFTKNRNVSVAIQTIQM